MKQVVAALIVRDDEILVCQRTRHQTMPLKWEFPGGKVEDGEEPHAALARELEEELGILAHVGPEVARIRHTYGKGGVIDLRFFLVKRYEGDIENKIFRDVQWARREKLPEYDFLEADLELVKDIAASRIL
jgi:8-oxo-dGTP diphosphatase